MSATRRQDAVAPEPMFVPPAGRPAAEAELGAKLAAALARARAGAVAPAQDAAAWARRLAGFDFTRPMALEAVNACVLEMLEHGLVQTGHARYFGLFNPAPSFAAECADRIAAAFNPQLASASTSPAAVAIEARVIAFFAGLAGLPAEASGHFTNGGSEANFTALICALVRAAPDYARGGARVFAGPPVFYASADCHLAWVKIALQAGIGRDAVRLVATDGAGRMDAAALAAALAADRAAGCVPVMIVATAGTTNAGAVDPLAACARLARRAGLWLHVDAAWGGAALLSARLKGRLAGIEAADSITIDGHKWLAATMGCGMFLLRHKAALECFHVAAGFMASAAAGRDPYLTSLQWSRRLVGLRLFMSLAQQGAAGLAAHVERTSGLAGMFAAMIARRGWRVLNDPALAVACVAPPGGRGVGEIVARVVAGGGAWLSVASFEGSQVARICLVNGASKADDVAALVDMLEAAREP